MDNTHVHQGVRGGFGTKSTEYALVKKTRYKQENLLSMSISTLPHSTFL